MDLEGVGVLGQGNGPAKFKLNVLTHIFLIKILIKLQKQNDSKTPLLHTCINHSTETKVNTTSKTTK